MSRFQKRYVLALFVLALAGAGTIGVAPVRAEDPWLAPGAPPARAPAETAAAPQAAPEAETPPASRAERLDALFKQLATPDLADAPRVEGDIQRLWGQSGSAALDLLLRRAQEAVQAQNFEVALDHLNAAIDHDPDFAEAWNARASIFYQMNEYALAVNDIEHVLALEPRHFGAMEGLAMIFDETDHPDLALRVVLIARQINPNRESLKDAEDRLERELGASEA